MGRNNKDFKFAHEETIDNLSPSLNKFENKLSNAIGRGVRTTNGVKTMVRVGSDWDKKGAPAILRGKASHGVVDSKTVTAPMPTRKRDINKAVNKLHKKVAK